MSEATVSCSVRQAWSFTRLVFIFSLVGCLFNLQKTGWRISSFNVALAAATLVSTLTGLWLCGLYFEAKRYEEAIETKLAMDEGDRQGLVAIATLLRLPDNELQTVWKEKVATDIATPVGEQLGIPDPAQLTVAEIRATLDAEQEAINVNYLAREWPEEPYLVEWWRKKFLPES